MGHVFTPFFRSPFTDITGGMISHQLNGRCQRFEMKLMVCLEHYGLDRGLRKCSGLLDDFTECQTLKKQYGRWVAMFDERQKQIKEGKLQGHKQYVSPKVDSY